MSEDKNFGSTMLPSEISSPAIKTSQLLTDELQLNGNKITNISQSCYDNDHKYLVTSFTLDQAKQALMYSIESLGHEVETFILSPVLSNPIVSPTFQDLEKWHLTKFTVNNGVLIYYNDDNDDINAKFRLTPEAFLVPGSYYVELVVDTLPVGGKLKVSNSSNEEILEITTTGKHKFTVEVPNPSVYWLDFTSTGIVNKTYISISYCGVYHVRSEFISYLNHMVEYISSGGSGYVSTDDLNVALENLNNSISRYVNTSIAIINDTITPHISDTTNNPHNVNIAMIGAAPADHTHNFGDMGDVGDSIVVPLEKAIEDIAALVQKLNEHLSTVNPHALNAEMVGAASVSHTHEIKDIPGLEGTLEGIVTLIEVTIPSQIATLTNLVQDQSTDVRTIEDALSTHTHTGLEGHNASYATPAEATAGINNNKLMTPELTRHAVNSWASWTDMDVTRLQPALISQVSLTSDETSVVVPVKMNTKYIFRLSGDAQHDLTTIKMSPDLGNEYISKIHVDNTIYEESGFDQHRLSLKMKSFNGEYHYDTKHDTLIGRGVCYVKDVDTTEITTTAPWEIRCISCPTTRVTVTDISELTISTTDNSSGKITTIDVYELIPYQEYSVAVDTLPVGSVCQFMGNKPRRGYSLLDGSVLPRNMYIDLYQEAVVSGSIIPQSEYDTILANDGYCEFYGDGDGSTMFRLPMMYPRPEPKFVVHLDASDGSVLVYDPWDASTAYVVGDIVSHDGINYIAIVDSGQLDEVTGSNDPKQPNLYGQYWTVYVDPSASAIVISENFSISVPRTNMNYYVKLVKEFIMNELIPSP